MNIPINGEYICYRIDGSILYKCYYKNNKKHGLYIHYYQNGSIKTIGYFKFNQFHGRWIDYDISDNINCYGKITSDILWIYNKPINYITLDCFNFIL